MPVLQKNQLVICPAGGKFMPVGTAREVPPRFATNTLGRVRMTQGVLQVEPGGTLVSSPQGIYIIVAERFFDETGQGYDAGTTVFIPPESAVSVAAKVGGGNGRPVEIVQVQPRPYPRSAKAMAFGGAVVGAAVILGSAMLE